MNFSRDSLLSSFKQMAADYATKFVVSNTVVGLGHGSTAILAVRNIAALIKTGDLTNIVGIPCSKFIEEEANHLGIPVSNLTTYPVVDLTIDGADEVDPQLNLIKGGGGALLMEKRVAKASKREIIIVDHTKFSPQLGANWAVPIEIDPDAEEDTLDALRTIGATPSMRINQDNLPFITDSKNHIVDANFGPIEDVDSLAINLESISGMVDHGLFIGLATDVIIAGDEGIRHLTSP